MKKIKKLIISACMSALFILSGCASSPDLDNTPSSEEFVSLAEIRSEAEDFSVQYNNLDFTDTVFIIPDKDSIPNLECALNSENVEEKMISNIKTLKGINEIDTKDFFYIIKNDDNENIRIPVSDMKDEERSGNNGYTLNYNDGSDWAVLYGTSYMMEIGHGEPIEELTGQIMDDTWGVRGLDCGTLVATYDISDGNIPDEEYLLSDGTISIRDAVAKAEQCINQDYYFVRSDLLDNRVFRVQVWSLDDNTYYYQFEFATWYNGIMFNKEQGGQGMDDAEELDYAPFAESHVASMFHKDNIDYIWACCNNYEQITETEVNDKFISLKNACDILSASVSENKIFNISEVSIVYETDFCYDSVEENVLYISHVECHPIYKFKVANPNISGYGALYFFVDALTGKVSITHN